MSDTESQLQVHDEVTIPFYRKKATILRFDHPDVRRQAYIEWPDGSKTWALVSNLTKA